RALRLLGPALHHLPHLALIVVRVHLGGQLARIPRARPAGIADLLQELAVADEGREEHDAGDFARMLLLVEQRAHAAERRAGEPDLPVAGALRGRDDLA